MGLEGFEHGGSGGTAVTVVSNKLEGHSGGVVEELRSFLTESLGRTTADESVLQTTWLALQAELSRLTALKPSLAEMVAEGEPAASDSGA